MKIRTLLTFHADGGWRTSSFVTDPIAIEDGEIVLSEAPDCGAEADEEGLRAHPVIN